MMRNVFPLSAAPLPEGQPITRIGKGVLVRNYQYTGTSRS